MLNCITKKLYATMKCRLMALLPMLCLQGAICPWAVTRCTPEELDTASRHQSGRPEGQEAAS